MKEFSGLKLTATILCAVVIMTFFGSMSLLIDAGMAAISSNYIDEIYDLALYSDNESSEKAVETLSEIGEEMESQVESIKENLEEDKEILGEDFPADGVFLYRLICVCQSNNIISTLEWCLCIGVTIGIGLYIIVIQRAKGSTLLKELIVAAIVLTIAVLILMLGFELIFNLAIQSEGFDITITNDYSQIYKILIMYVVSIVIVYFINLIYEKTFTQDDNKKGKKTEKKPKRKNEKDKASSKKKVAKKNVSKEDKEEESK